MSSAIIKNKYEDILHIRCHCGAFEIVEIGHFDDEDEPFYFTITASDKTLKDKLRIIWRVIRGSRYGITDEVLFDNKDARKIIKWLQKHL